MSNYRLTLSYDGSRYNGWQRQGNTPNTVQGKLEELLSRLLEQRVDCAGAGRTDAGVHARGQTVSFRAETDKSPAELLELLRRCLPEDIGAEDLSVAPPRFHARLSCTGKTYLYRVWDSPAPCVFQRKYVLRVPGPLDDAAMARAAGYLLGEHDFSAFHTGRLNRKRKSPVRRLDRLDVERAAGELRLWFSGSGFLYNMVRILTGTLLEVGAGTRSPEELPRILDSRDRQNAGPTAPAKGLCLWETRYESSSPVPA